MGEREIVRNIFRYLLTKIRGEKYDYEQNHGTKREQNNWTNYEQKRWHEQNNWTKREPKKIKREQKNISSLEMKIY